LTIPKNTFIYYLPNKGGPTAAKYALQFYDKLETRHQRISNFHTEDEAVAAAFLYSDIVKENPNANGQKIKEMVQQAMVRTEHSRHGPGKGVFWCEAENYWHSTFTIKLAGSKGPTRVKIGRYNTEKDAMAALAVAKTVDGKKTWSSVQVFRKALKPKLAEISGSFTRRNWKKVADEKIRVPL
jgi:hypothetical protein